MWLLVGGDSEIGAETAAYMRARQFEAISTTRRSKGAAADAVHLDLGADLEGWEPPPGAKAACIFAAVARLAACAADPAATARINVTQTLALVDRLLARDLYTIFLSTNQVFDGSTPNVAATAPTCPVSVYGQQKARTEAGLQARMERGAPVAVLRLAKIVSPRTALLRQWVDALSAGRPIRAFKDMTMAPVEVARVAAVVVALMQARAAGTFQLTALRDVTYFETGRHLADRLGADARLVAAGSVAEAALPAGAAPPHTTLDSSEIETRFGIAAPDPWDAIDREFSFRA
ncbi:MAG: sugar nucleotide-binding protein [Methylobacteriaceae bacterium]|nr:sugar nucleotide-binding protein [Methylobacteriaceae bacterium]